MSTALALLLLVASAASFWGAASYAQGRWPARIQYVASWIVTSLVIAAIWACASFAYDLFASPVYYCGFQDAAPCGRADFIEEQLSLWVVVFFVGSVPVVALAGAGFFILRAALPKKSYPAPVKASAALPSALQICLCAAGASSSIFVPPSDPAATVVKGGILVVLAAGSWLLAGRAAATAPATRDKAWLWYSFAATLFCAAISTINISVQMIGFCDGIVGDPHCRARTTSSILRQIPFSLAFAAILYVIPVLCAVRFVMLARSRWDSLGASRDTADAQQR